ncbi:MAG: hypothetical protein R3F11_09575 [Verrucomicrobiales bacterium]
MFSGSIKGMDAPAKAEVNDLRVAAQGKGFVASGRVTADPPAYAVVAYMDPAERRRLRRDDPRNRPGRRRALRAPMRRPRPRQSRAAPPRRLPRQRSHLDVPLPVCGGQ